MHDCSIKSEGDKDSGHPNWNTYIDHLQYDVATIFQQQHSVWLAQLVKALAALTHVRPCVQEVRVRSPEQTSLTLASISPG